MLRSRSLRIGPLLFVALFAACKDETTGTPIVDSGNPSDDGSKPDAGGNHDGATTDAPIIPPGDGGKLVPCLDRPTDLDRPPSGSIPCELLPPGFIAP